MVQQFGQMNGGHTMKFEITHLFIKLLTTRNFVNPINGVHAQNIESLWNKLKKRIKKQNGNTFDSLKLNLKEWMDGWMWKDNIAKVDFKKIFEC